MYRVASTHIQCDRMKRQFHHEPRRPIRPGGCCILVSLSKTHMRHSGDGDTQCMCACLPHAQMMLRMRHMCVSAYVHARTHALTHACIAAPRTHAPHQQHHTRGPAGARAFVIDAVATVSSLPFEYRSSTDRACAGRSGYPQAAVSNYTRSRPNTGAKWQRSNGVQSAPLKHYS